MDPIELHRQMAMDHLVAELREEAPQSLEFAAAIDEQPLEGEGRVSIFTFKAALGSPESTDYYAIAGRTQPMHYPSWGLSPDEIYCVHIGTRFMLELKVSQVRGEEIPADLADRLVQQASASAGEHVLLAGEPTVYRVEAQHHAVCPAAIREERWYIVGGDINGGFYERTELPAHVIYRWHLGQIIRNEQN